MECPLLERNDVPQRAMRSKGSPLERSPAQATQGGASHPDRVPAACLVVFLSLWVALAIAPRHREDWVLENLPTFLAVPLLVATHRRLRFSDRAYVQITAFLLLHSIGSHYTYSEVPLGHWASAALGLSRNHYDRFVHLAAGLLLLRPVEELAFGRGRAPGRLATMSLCVAAIAGSSALYEITEWLVAIVVDPAAGTAFLGTQGDVWDAQKDMALCTGGAVVAAMIEARLAPPAAAGRDRGRQR